MASEGQPTGERSEDFEREIIEHMETLYGVALRLTRDPADARDLQQDTLVRALRFHYKFKEGTYTKAWLLTILRNTFINDYRRKARRPAQVELSGAEHLTSNEADREMGYLPREFKRQHVLEFLGDEVRHAVDALPERHRRTLIMADLQGMSYKEIAEEMKCPLGTVMSRLHRGRRLMRESLPNQTREMAFG
ncbi:MAG: sigma-70 family RNA polymerase sigma factor [Candidatus Hydrogenedentes bacterium]|nr:sigma-70 family RNA polymerase sigma factor [Candidatus Hydrogenedentota bacterium]